MKKSKKIDWFKVIFAMTFIATTAMLIHKVVTSGFLFFIVNY